MRFRLLIAFLFISILAEARLPDLIPYRKGNLWGYCDSTKKMLLEAKWEDCTLFYRGKARVRENGKWGIIDSLGKYILEPQWEECWRDFDGRYLVLLNKKWGLIDSAGNYILPPKYFELFTLTSTRIIAYKDQNHAGLIDDHDSIIVPFKAQWISWDADSVLGCAYPGEMFVCDFNGKPILKEHEYVAMDGGLGAAAKFGLFVVIRKSERGKRRNDCMGYIVVDTADRQVIPGRYDNIELIGDSIFECQGSDSTSYFDLHGNPVFYFPTVEQRIQERSPRRAPVKTEREMELFRVTKMVHDEYWNYTDVLIGYKDWHGTEYWEE